MNSFPISSKKVVIIFLLVFLVVLLGAVFWLLAAKIQARDVLKYISSRGLMSVVEIHNNENVRSQWQLISEKYKKDTAGASLLGVSEEEVPALLASLPAQSYLIAFESDIVFAFADEGTLAQKKLTEALKKNFTVVVQDGFVLAGNTNTETLKAHIFTKDSGTKKIADSISRSTFDNSALISVAAPENVSLNILGDRLVSQVNEAVYKVFVRDILSQMTRLNGNLYVTSEGYLTMTGKIQMPKEELQYFVQRDKLDMSVFASIPTGIPVILVFVAEPGLVNSFTQYLKEQKTESMALSWQYLVEALFDQVKLIDQPMEVMSQLEKGSVAVGITSSGSVFTSVAGIEKAKIEKISELLKSGVEKNLAYEEITMTLPDKTKAVMLERHPEKVSLHDKSSSGGLIKEITFNDLLQARITADGENFIITNSDHMSPQDKVQYEILQKYFKEPVQWFVKSGITLPVAPVPYLSDIVKEDKMSGNQYTSFTVHTDGINYRVLFIPTL